MELIPQQVMPKFVDVNGDGEITSDDQTMIGSPHPKLIYGGNINLSFKGFDLSVFLQGMSWKSGFNRLDQE